MRLAPVGMPSFRLYCTTEHCFHACRSSGPHKSPTPSQPAITSSTPGARCFGSVLAVPSFPATCVKFSCAFITSAIAHPLSGAEKRLCRPDITALDGGRSCWRPRLVRTTPTGAGWHSPSCHPSLTPPQTGHGDPVQQGRLKCGGVGVDRELLAGRDHRHGGGRSTSPETWGRRCR